MATGPMQLYVCTNGIVAMVKNGLISSDITAEVIFAATPSMTMVEFVNSQAPRLFNFMDPVSKLSFRGHKAILGDPTSYSGNVVFMLIEDHKDSCWLPPSSKVILLGWNYFEQPDWEQKAREAAQESLKGAYGRVNLRSNRSARELLSTYRELLGSDSSEGTLQTFLDGHPEFLCPEHEVMLSKPTLGGERQPDFAFRIRSALGPRWIFVEIERPNKSIFTKGKEFQFTHEFTQAKGQLLQWDTLITQDLPYFAKRFDGLHKPEFYLVYGRDAELDAPRRHMLSAEFSSSSNRTFNSFDDLAERFARIISRVFPGTSEPNLGVE
ncbi:MAG: DUF4263 domain-containing protein [Acidobacteria bacterium]|nr:DUF4263 domain-containing protein [Acidobacteriota bacterium]